MARATEHKIVLVTQPTRLEDLIRRYKSPLVKTKAFTGESSQSPERLLELVERLNPDLATAIRLEAPSRPAPPIPEAVVRAAETC